jgi:hypothetical protein
MRRGVTYTRTFTVEERALGAMCHKHTVRLPELGVEGTIQKLALSDGDSLLRATVVDQHGKDHEVDLKYGVVIYT